MATIILIFQAIQTAIQNEKEWQQALRKIEDPAND